jgi:hypothetical protein
MRRLLVSLSAVALVSGFAAVPNGFAQQSVNFYVGGFTPRAIDARPDDDILVANGLFLSTLNKARGIDIGEFNNVTIGGEWLFGIVRNLEGGLGIGFYQRSVPTLYTDLVNTNGTDIEQTLKLRIVPFTATLRYLPMGSDQLFQPYIGAGVGVYRWRYSETGQFVDFQNNVFTGNFVGDGAAAGPAVVGGLRFMVEPVTAGFEIRYQAAEGELPFEEGFAGDTVDLGGFNYLFTMGFRF